MWRNVLASLLLVTGCTSDPAESAPPLNVPDGCNPLGAGASDADCLLPYPSDVYRAKDDTSKSFRLVFPDSALPRDKQGRAVSPVALRPASGFSPGTQILASFPEGIDPTNLVGATRNLEDSLAADSPTVLMDESGKRVLHLAELDPRAAVDARRALVLRPLTRLENGKRYIVALRNLRGLDGAPLPAREGFRRLRDGQADTTPAFTALGDFEGRVLAPLEKAGISRDTLQLAWDFTVRDEDEARRDLLKVRELVLAAATPKLTVTGTETLPGPNGGKRIDLELEVPLFLDADEPMAHLHRDASGEVATNGVTKVIASVWIPTSVFTSTDSASQPRLMQFGHGFFGKRTEVEDFALEFAGARGMTVMATDWSGMAEGDKIPLTNALTKDVATALAFCDRTHQAFANQLALAKAAESIALMPETLLPMGRRIDGSRVYFYGISMGSILGSTYLALSPTIDRGVLSVGGADWSMMMFRARPFLGFLAFVQLSLPDALDQQKFAAFAQTEMDRIDPLTYAPLVLDEPLAGSPSDRRVLMQVGIGDAAVPNLASHLLGRAVGVKHLTPAPRAIAGLDDVTGPYSGSALVEFDFGIDPLPSETAQPSLDDTPAHDGVRHSPAGQEQIDRFFRPNGTIESTCDGPCDPN